MFDVEDTVLIEMVFSASRRSWCLVVFAVMPWLPTFVFFALFVFVCVCVCVGGLWVCGCVVVQHTLHLHAFVLAYLDL